MSRANCWTFIERIYDGGRLVSEYGGEICEDDTHGDKDRQNH